jgi:outer membrane protein assembly factor BamB
MPHSKIIYLGIKGSVIAMNAATGEQLWTVHLKSSEFVNVVLDGDNLYATTQGEIFCLDPQTGEGRWQNKLKGFGWGLVSIAGEGIAANPPLLQAEEKRRRDQRSSDNTANTSAAS